jgi:hypothetical protein
MLHLTHTAPKHVNIVFIKSNQHFKFEAFQYTMVLIKIKMHLNSYQTQSLQEPRPNINSQTS